MVPDLEAVLRYSRELQVAADLTAILRAAHDAVGATTRYDNVWLAVFEDGSGGEFVRLLALSGPAEAVVWAHSPLFPVEGDAMLAEIREGGRPVVVVDARTDPRTNKTIVAQHQSKTIVNIPLLLDGDLIGALGVGTFGDEPCLAPWPEELEMMTLFAAQLAAAFDRVRLLERERAANVEREALERRLHQERRLAASVFDTSSDAVILTTPAGDILSVNQAFELISGYSAAEAVGKNPRFLSSGLQDREFYRRLWQALLEQGHWTGELVNRAKNGSLYTSQVTLNAVKDDAGRLLHYVGVSTDITARKRHEAALSEARQRAEGAALAKATFLATMSHEVRTPLNGVLGMSDLLLLAELPPAQRDQVQIIRSSADALLTLLNQILDFSRIEASGVTLVEAPFDPAALVNGVVATFGASAEARGLRLVQQLDPGLPHTVLGDPARLRQVLTNLLSNALKFTHAGRVTVSGAAEQRAGEPPVLRLAVSDTGIGIPADQQEHVFDAFSQVDGSATRRYGGTGLGLTLCRRISQAMGATLTVESQAGAGSTFTLRCPMKRAASGPPQPAPFCATQEPPRSGVARRRVLVVEDTRTNQLVLRAMLQKLGHQVEVVSDGAQAVSAVTAQAYDLVLMDVQMPVMDGLAATREIRALEQRRGGRVKIVALTANTFASDREACARAGMDGFLSKPVRVDMLAGLLDQAP